MTGGVPSTGRAMRESDYAARGLAIRVCAWGPTEGPTVVCCHGWLDQGAAWDAVAGRLAVRGFRVLAPDHRGHGHSAWTPPGTTYHFMEYVADLEAVLDEAQVASAILVGHSMGGTIASLYAGLRPERVRGLVLLDGLGPGAVERTHAVDQAGVFLDQCRAPRPHKPMASMADAAERIRRTNPSLSLEAALRLAKRATRVSEAGLVWRWDPLHRTRAAVAYDEARHLETLRRIQAPVAVGIGRDGWYPHMQGLEARIQALSWRMAYEALPAGHDLHHAFPDKVVEWVEAVSRASATERSSTND